MSMHKMQIWAGTELYKVYNIKYILLKKPYKNCPTGRNRSKSQILFHKNFSPQDLYTVTLLMSNAMSIAENNNNFAKLTYFSGKKRENQVNKINAVFYSIVCLI